MGKIKFVGIGVVLILAGVVASESWAGYKVTTGVSVSPGFSASGVMAARNSATTNDYIGCRVEAYNGASVPTVVCFAQDTQNDYLSCSIASEVMASIVGAMTINSVINFQVNSGGSTCTYLRVGNYSYYAPMWP